MNRAQGLLATVNELFDLQNQDSSFNWQGAAERAVARGGFRAAKLGAVVGGAYLLHKHLQRKDAKAQKAATSLPSQEKGSHHE